MGEGLTQHLLWWLATGLEFEICPITQLDPMSFILVTLIFVFISVLMSRTTKATTTQA